MMLWSCLPRTFPICNISYLRYHSLPLFWTSCLTGRHQRLETTPPTLARGKHLFNLATCSIWSNRLVSWFAAAVFRLLWYITILLPQLLILCAGTCIAYDICCIIIISTRPKANLFWLVISIYIFEFMTFCKHTQWWSSVQDPFLKIASYSRNIKPSGNSTGQPYSLLL